MNSPMFQATKPLEAELIEKHTPFNMKRQHYHDNFEIYLQLDGERNLFFDNEKYVLKKGSLFVINPFVLHVTTSADKPHYKRYGLNISPSALSDILSDRERDLLFKKLHTCVVELDDERFNTACVYFGQIERFQNDLSDSSTKLMRMAVALLLELIADTIKKGAVILTAENKGKDTPILRALTYINSNYDKRITLDFLCDYIHMSKSNFCLSFKKTVGDTPMNYINTLRLANVHKLLLNTDLPLTEIAKRTGFETADYMSRIFKKIHGMSPTKFRKLTPVI